MRSMAENKLQSEMSELPFTIYKNLFQQADEGMIICDSKGTIVSWNEALSQFTGKNEKDVINTPIWNYPDLLVNNPDFNKSLKLFYISVGEQDPRIDATNKFVNTLRQNKMDVEYTTFPGIHEWQVWRMSLYDFLPRLFSQ